MLFSGPQVSEGPPPLDDPDLSIRSDHLVDDGAGEIKTVVADGASFYTSGGCGKQRRSVPSNHKAGSASPSRLRTA